MLPDLPSPLTRPERSGRWIEQGLRVFDGRAGRRCCWYRSAPRTTCADLRYMNVVGDQPVSRSQSDPGLPVRRNVSTGKSTKTRNLKSHVGAAEISRHIRFTEEVS